MEWTWWDWSLILKTLSSFSAVTVGWVVWSAKTRPCMTYNVFVGTLNLTDSTKICNSHCHWTFIVLCILQKKLQQYKCCCNKTVYHCVLFESQLSHTENEQFPSVSLRFSGSSNSNMLSKISAELKELPQQPNLEKNQPKLHKFQYCARNRWIFRM